MFLTADQFLLTTLVVKITIVAALATILVRYHRFRHILISERRAWPERLLFAFSLGVPLAAGVTSRLLLNYDAADLTLEGAFLAGLIAGPVCRRHRRADGGAAGAARRRVHRAVLCRRLRIRGRRPSRGVSRTKKKSGTSRRSCSPSSIAIVWRMLRNVERRLGGHSPARAGRARVDRARRSAGASISPQLTRLFFLHTEVMSPGGSRSIVLTTVLCVATPIKIWNNARIEHRLEEQEKLLLTARVEALASQINPHFLFNTLTSIQSLIRTNPETARTVIVKLSGLLRRLLRSRDHFVTLREELESIDEYLDIEVIRFGPQLKVEKQISPDTLDIIVPSMILQPLVENSIKHGFSRKVGGGRIVIRSVRQNGHAIIEVEDDGLGMTEDRLDTALTDGIGLSNVNERLSVIYGAAYRVRITSVPNLGTIIRLEIPDMVSAERITA